MQSTKRTLTSTLQECQNATVKRSHGVNVQNLKQKIENHPQRQALQSDLQQHREFNPFSKESQDVIKAAGNTELCELLDVEPEAQCKACLAYWDAVLSTARFFTSYEMIRQITRSTSSPFLISSLSRTFTSGRADHTVTDTERKKVIKNTTLRINSRRNVRNENSLSSHDRFIRDARFRKDHDWVALKK